MEVLADRLRASLFGVVKFLTTLHFSVKAFPLQLQLVNFPVNFRNGNSGGMAFLRSRNIVVTWADYNLRQLPDSIRRRLIAGVLDAIT